MTFDHRSLFMSSRVSIFLLRGSTSSSNALLVFCKSFKPESVSSHQEYLCTKFWSSIALAAVVQKLSKFVSLFIMSIITSKSNVSIIFFTFPGPLLFMHIFLGNYKYKIFDNKPNIQPGPCIRLHDPVSDCMTL